MITYLTANAPSLALAAVVAGLWLRVRALERDAADAHAAERHDRNRALLLIGADVLDGAEHMERLDRRLAAVESVTYERVCPLTKPTPVPVDFDRHRAKFRANGSEWP